MSKAEEVGSFAVMTGMTDPLASVRRAVARNARALIAGQGAPPERGFAVTTADQGLFGCDSATWVVHADLAMLVGGLRALLLQTLHPLAIAGVVEHSDYRQDPWGRLHRTGRFLASTTFGSTAQANSAIAAVRRVHERVRGTAPDGRRYSATDPHLVTWVHVTEVGSFLASHQRYGKFRLSGDEADSYIAEMATVGRKLGGVEVPTSVAELEAWLEAVRPELRAGRQAGSAVRFLLAPPAPLVARGPYGVVVMAAVGLLPAWARRMLWLPLMPGVDPLVVRPACHAVLRGLRWALEPPPAPVSP